MHGRCQLFRANRTILLGVLLAACLAASPGTAQNRDGFSQPVTFKVFNATSRAPGAVERLSIDNLTSRLNNLVDTRPSGSAFTIAAVPLRDSGKYIVTAWWQGVPYWFKFRGSAMVADTLTLNVFDTTEDLQDVTIAGMNLVVQRQGETLKLEYLLHLENTTVPQQTVLGSDYTLSLAMPAGASDVNATYTRGPEPTPIKTFSLAAGQLGLTVPLTSGKNTLRLECRVPWSEGLALPVGFNVPVQAWSFLISPDWIQVKAMDLEPDPAPGFNGYNRFRGPVIAAGRRFEMRLNGNGNTPGQSGKIFTAESDSSVESSDGNVPDIPSTKGGFPVRLLLVLALIALVLLFVVNRRKNS